MAVSRVVDIARRVAEADPFEIALADTIGVGVPTQVIELVGRVSEAVPGVALRCHFHNTRNTGLANAFAAVQAGVRTLDASIGGIGGCPFAPAATGQWLQGRLGRPVPGMLVKAGDFPRPGTRAA